MFCEACIVLTCLAIVYNYVSRNFDFWKKRNVKGPRPVPFFGNYKDCLLGKIHPTEFTKRFYDEFKEEPMVGIFVQNTPVLILRDLDLIKDVLIKDFSVFSDRGIRVHDTVEPLSQHLFNLTQTIWHPLRSKLSPAFTASKIRNLFDSMVKIADRFKVYVEGKANNSDSLECSELVAKFAIEVIGECGFGLKMDQFLEINEFGKINGERRKKNDIWNFARRFIREYWPQFYKFCYFYNNKRTNNYYVDSVRQIFEYRKINNIQRDDYVGILMKLKNNPQIISKIELTDNFLAAQAYVFFTAGTDTTAIILSNALYELANNLSIQENLRDEIAEVIQSNDAKLTFDCIKKMKYLDKIFKETLRKYPLRNIIRNSMASYTFSGTNVTIPKNTQIVIPHYSIHRDDQIYPDPEIFDPERFDENEKQKRHPMAYLPFGEGPRYCIGSRFADILCKIIIVTIVQNFTLRVTNVGCSRNQNDPRKVLLSPKGGIRLRFNKNSNP